MNSGASLSFCFTLVHGTLMATEPSFHPSPTLRVAPGLGKCSRSNRRVAVTALKPSRSDGLKSGCLMMLWTRSFVPAGVFPDPMVIHARRRSSDWFFELVRGSCCGPAGATAAKPDPMDWGWGATVVVGTSAKASGLRGLWEESVKYSRNTPKELAFVSVRVVFADLAEPSIPSSSRCGPASGGGGCSTASFTFESDWLCTADRWPRWTGTTVGKESRKRAGSRRLLTERWSPVSMVRSNSGIWTKWAKFYLPKSTNLLIAPVVALVRGWQLPMPSGLRGVVSCAPLHPLHCACASAPSHFPETSVLPGHSGGICIGVCGVHEPMKMYVALGQRRSLPHNRYGT